MTQKLVLGISGASGAPYAKRLLEHFRALGAEAPRVEIVLSRTAEQVWAHECGGNPRDLGFPVFEGRDYAAPFASGSARYDGMLVLPASMSAIARIAHGVSDDLLTRAADVMLKERKRLVLVPREAPYSAIHLDNMLSVTRAGAVVLPASPSFYSRPASLEDAMDTVLARVLDHLGVEHGLSRRWGREIKLGKND
ncbi:MAG TPA: UbiX family flavin prenyltransferase [Polyangiales bacterium]|nr:UbiX family flavin prenyltransferase [Polyangiales bacterium]